MSDPDPDGYLARLSRQFGNLKYFLQAEATQGRIPDAWKTPKEKATEMTDAEVDTLAQVIRKAHVMTQIGRHSGFTLTPWDDLVGRERAPYIASAVAAYRHIKGHETDV